MNITGCAAFRAVRVDGLVRPERRDMTKEELQQILIDVWHREISADDAFDLIASELRDDEAEAENQRKRDACIGRYGA